MEDLINRIFEVFKSAPYPGDDKLICHQCDECHRLRDDFKGKKAQEVDSETVYYHQDSLPLFSDEAKRYFLPAFLRESIMEPQRTITEFLLYSFDSDHRWKPKGGYTKEQVKIVNEYFDFIEHYLDEFDKNIYESAKLRWLINTEPGH
jgi:hypothetical protein